MTKPTDQPIGETLRGLLECDNCKRQDNEGVCFTLGGKGNKPNLQIKLCRRCVRDLAVMLLFEVAAT